ncbi:MAG: Efflux ABC transporter, permease protein, partial [uncultured Frankineae bacterium]
DRPHRRTRELAAARLPAAPDRAGRHRRGRVPRGHDVPALLALDDLLLGHRADDLPAGLRLRLRLARRAGRRLRLHRLRRHRHRRHRRPVRLGLPRHVRHLHQAGLPEDLRRGARRAGGHRGARHRGGAVDLAAGGGPRRRADAGGDRLRPRAVARDAARAADRRPDRLRLRGLRHLGVGHRAVHRLVRLRHLGRPDTAVPRRRDLLPDRRPARVGVDRGAAQPALPLRGARPARRLRLPARRRRPRGRAGGVRRGDVGAGRPPAEGPAGPL